VTDKSDGHTFKQDISMNDILSYDHYRFYQMSYNTEDNSSTLAVNYDPYGIPVSYAGYYLLFLSSIWILFDRRCGFQMKLIGMGDIDRLMKPGRKKTGFPTHYEKLQELVAQPDGKPKLVPASHPAPAFVQSVEDDFEEQTVDDDFDEME
jgi:hypothetical protein